MIIDGDSEVSLSDEKKRLARLQADKLEIEIATLKGQLLLFSDVEREMSDVVISFRAKMLSIPSKLAPELAMESNPMIIEERLRSEIKEALSELSRVDAGRIAEKQVQTLRKGATTRHSPS